MKKKIDWKVTVTKLFAIWNNTDHMNPVVKNLFSQGEASFSIRQTYIPGDICPMQKVKRENNTSGGSCYFKIRKLSVNLSGRAGVFTTRCSFSS